MIGIVLFRILLAALPFAVYFLWRRLAMRSGRPMGSTPWAWLICAGAVLAGLSLMLSVAFHADNRAERYVPAEPDVSGAVRPGHFEPIKPQS
jgi:drug/metabolite transporter (DMT)-like permease